MKRRPCYRIIDKPILLLGFLEPDEVFFLGVLSSLLMLFCPDPGVACLVIFFIVYGLRKIKKGKPSGYLTHWLYKIGFSVQGFIPPIKKVRRYSAFRKIK